MKLIGILIIFGLLLVITGILAWWIWKKCTKGSSSDQNLMKSKGNSVSEATTIDNNDEEMKTEEENLTSETREHFLDILENKNLTNEQKKDLLNVLEEKEELYSKKEKNRKDRYIEYAKQEPGGIITNKESMFDMKDYDKKLSMLLVENQELDEQLRDLQEKYKSITDNIAETAKNEDNIQLLLSSHNTPSQQKFPF